MPPFIIVVAGAVGAYFAYRFLKTEAAHAAALRAEMEAAARSERDIESLVVDPKTGAYRPASQLARH